MRILVVDPSRFGLKFMTSLLEERGHAVFPFQDGLVALDYLKADRDVEVVITSFELGGLSGLELCWEARALSTQEQRPLHVIILSSSHDGAKLVEALDSGADDFIRKPPDEQELSARLRSAERIISAQRELIRLANMDSLTGIYNRRAFFDKAARICETATPDRPVTTIMFDIDHFKRVNDNFGHDVGDTVIKAMAALASQVDGVVGRLGGEEFACILSNCDEERANWIAEGLREGAIEKVFDTGAVMFGVTISVGVSLSRSPEPLDLVLKRADIALYQAKANGRNRIVVDGSIPQMAPTKRVAWI